MIIKTHSSIAQQKQQASWLKIGAILLIGGFLIWGAFLSIKQLGKTPTSNNTNASVEFTLLADAEVAEGNYLVVDGHKVNSSKSQTQEEVYEGDYAIKLHAGGERYGFSAEFKDVQVGERFHAQVWAYSPHKELPYLVMSGADVNELYVESKNFEATNNWQLLEVSVLIKKPIKNNLLKLYCFNRSEHPIYFDNLSYYRSNAPNPEDIANWKPEKVNLFLKKGAYNKLQEKRLEAFERGILVNSDDSWVKGFIYPEHKKDEKVKVSLRLKGDWTDHLQGDQWSFRVKTQTDKSWNRLKTFSLQTPGTRSYLFEWMLHQLFIYEDVLTTRYEFINVQLNNKDLGLYVYEEHFLKQLPEYNKKKEGPIIKFVEGGYWERLLKVQELGLDFSEWETGTPDIKPFTEKKTAQTPLLAEQYKIAQNLLYEYQYGIKAADDVFDIDLLAKYYAIIDLTASYHGKAWHNQRFYYNPVIGKLEPIGFDGFGSVGLDHTPAAPFLGSNLCYPDDRKQWHERLFVDEAFIAKYVFYLEQFSREEYIRAFLDKIMLPLYQRRSYIQKTEPDYKFNPNYIYDRGKKILNALYPTNQSLHNKTVEKGLIAVCNRHKVPLSIVGTSSQEKGSVTYFDKPEFIFTTPPHELPDYSRTINVPELAKFLVYKVHGLEQLHYVAINQWPVPTAFSPVQELTGNLVNNHPAYIYNKENKRVVFKKNAIVKEPIIIPRDHDVILEAGASVDIINQAFVLSYSNVQSIGTEDEPILIQSSDQSGRSFTVIKAKKKSNLRYTTFSNLDAFSYKGWNLPAATNFYESDVDIYYTTFTKNHCEDALNVVRAHFNFEYNTISHTWGDGFDSDFCTGIVSNCRFYNTGNDAIDFSTSVVTIKDCIIEKAGDKGISMGEQGTASIINTVIDGAVIGVASKDLSKTTVKNVTLRNCKTGFSAYQKKPEYGHGFIYVDSYTSEQVDVLHKILPGSYLRLIDQEITSD